MTRAEALLRVIVKYAPSEKAAFEIFDAVAELEGATFKEITDGILATLRERETVQP